MFTRRQRCSSWIRAWWVVALSLLAILGSTAAYSSSGGSSSYPSCGSIVTSYVGDGECDELANNEECRYDGGDCCSCTCIDNTYQCGTSGFDCIDPSATAFACRVGTTSTASTSDLSCSGLTDYIGDGDCDSWNNNEECRYDDGDCCSCTCADALFQCGNSGFDCDDPAANCFGEDAPIYTTTNIDDYAENETGCTPNWSSDGFCDSINNTDECSYDGGDCCVCTCVSADYDCTSGFNCVDPGVDCKGGIGTGDDCSDLLVGDGSCDGTNNIAECLFDGGDCCSGKRCNSDDCIDPNSHCSGTASVKPSLERSRSNLLNVFVGVGAGCVGLIIAACLAMRCVNAMVEKRKIRNAQKALATTAEQ